MIHAICGCIIDIIHRKILITTKQKGALAKRKSVLRTLSNSRRKTSGKMKPLIHCSGHGWTPLSSGFKSHLTHFIWPSPSKEKYPLLKKLLKKFLIFYISGNRNLNKLLIFLEMELSNSNIKKFLIFWEMEPFSPPRENFLYFRERKPRKNFLYFLKIRCSSISGNRKPEKTFYISGNGTFFLSLYFSYISDSIFPSSRNEQKAGPKKILIYQEIELSYPQKT